MKKRKFIIVILSGLVLTWLFFKTPAPAERILNIQNYLITVGGIISTFVIAYLSAKIFNLRAERENRQIKIDELSDKLTDFRRLLYYVMSSREFWAHYEDIKKFRQKYPNLTYASLHGDPLSEDAKAVWNDEELSPSTIDLYCSMMAIYGEPDIAKARIWANDKSVSFHYSIDELKSFWDPCNQIWYYLDGRYSKHGRGRFTDNGMNPIWAPYVKDLLPKIDLKFKGADFHREIVAAIGSDFYEYGIPTLIKLLKRNTGVPPVLVKTFFSLIAIMTFGVIFPLIIQSINISDKLNILSTLTCVLLTVLSLIMFLFDFIQFLYEDVHIVQKSGPK